MMLRRLGKCYSRYSPSYLSSASRPFSGEPPKKAPSSKKPDWVIAAENEARAAQGNKYAGSSSVNNTFMSSLQHDMSSETVSATTRLQTKLEAQVTKLKALPEPKTSAQKMEFDEMRKIAVGFRNELVVQRESAGLTHGNEDAVRSAFPIPTRPED
jgi:hypothetical protein